MDIYHLLDFDFETAAFGTLRIGALATALFKSVKEEVTGSDVDAKELARIIFTNVARRLTGDASVDRSCGGPTITMDELKELQDKSISSPSSTKISYRSLIAKYEVIQNHHDYILGHYFKNLYQILKLVDTDEALDAEAKQKYASMLRAQLSSTNGRFSC
jgi:hypothetical protein